MLRLTGILAVYFFIFLLSELIINDRAILVLGVSSVVANYSIGIVFTALGYLAFAFSHGAFGNELARRAALGFFGALYLGAMSSVMFFAPPALFAMVTCACTLSMGYLGGFVHYHAAMAMRGSDYIGRVVGVSYFLAVSAQFAVQALAVAERALILCAAAGVILLAAVILRPPRGGFFENYPPRKHGPSASQRELWLTFAIVAFISALNGIYDGAITSLDAAGKLNLAGWPRLFMALGELSAGFIYDIRHRAYMQLASLCSVLFTTLSIVFLFSAPIQSMVIHYFMGGFYVVYLTVSFLDLAPRTSNPALWAGMGRVSRSFMVGLTTVPSEWLFTTSDIRLAVTANTFILVAVIVLFWVKGDLIPRKLAANPASGPDPGKKMTLSDFAAKYQLTPRETDIMGRILTSGKGVRELALEINISERVLYRHFNRLYEKTGATSRTDLLMIYYGGDDISEEAAPDEV
jgi:DNA-binding CsgD family transcriptional regulator